MTILLCLHVLNNFILSNDQNLLFVGNAVFKRDINTKYSFTNLLMKYNNNDAIFILHNW